MQKNNWQNSLLNKEFCELSGADIIIASTHIAGEITVTGNKYVVGVRNMLSPADFGPKLLEVIKEHFPQDVK